MIRKTSIDCIIITRNEESRISGCLKHVSWTDHTYVIDSGSTDDTVVLAKKAGASVREMVTDDFSRLRNEGAKAAMSDWLLYIDADETVTDDLRDEIEHVIDRSPHHNAYILPRNNFYLGYPWPYSDGMIRLIKKDALKCWEGSLHEHAVVSGSVGTLKHHVRHDTHRTLEEMVAKTNQWSATEARLRYDANHPPITWWRLLRVMCTGFIHSYISQGGWKAGVVGWIESIFQAFSMFITYAKLWEMQNDKRVKGKG